uniref:Uncharacterized protein n=1 Tax=Anguilla anguilla TaxID=7936 RepID=A0A0E9XSP1_ANGAN
MPPIFKLLKF